jgi:hypothetical protein
VFRWRKGEATCDRPENLADDRLRFLGKLASDLSYLRYMFDQKRSERIFAMTVVRILAAYRMGAMQYGCWSHASRDARSEGDGK